MTKPVTKTVLVVQPDASDPLDRFAGWFDEAGLAVRVIRPYDGEPLPGSVEADALVVLGGEMSVHDDATFGWLEGIRVLYRDAVAREVPVLGICLGAQLLAQTCGGEVVVGEAGIEAGVVEVRWRPAAAGDALLGGLPEPFPAGSMHGDAIATLPPGATWLGSSALYPHQAFRVSARAWGVQFHPEISPATYGEWADDFTGTDPDRVRVEEGRAAFTARDAEIERATRMLAERFAAVCA
ncbi:MAG: type 1 glutamine amidotransferase [Nocardioidaceae bacterium]|nr:type 1 glutamine amidotransferase [Nocardioidaceae bacterium]